MSAAASTSPFVGPKPFEQDQADLFKGREQEVGRLEALVLSRRAVLFYAASGVGKSSLINAGLLPKLQGGERGLHCEVLGVVRVSGAAGSNRDENVFTKSVLGQLKDGLGYSSLLDYLRDKYTPDEVVTTVGPKLVLLVIDQFEELFTTSPERWRDRLPFMKGLLEALEACAAADPVIDREEGPLFKIMHLRIVFCLREEYIAYLEQYYDLFPELRTARFRLEPLRREQARRAIVEPTRKSGRAFSHDLVEEIIGELIEAPQVTTHDALPKPKNGWIARLEDLFTRAFFHVPEVGHRDQQYVVEGEYVEPVQLQVICSDIWESAAPGEKVVSRNSLPKGWSVDVGLGRFYDQAIDFACRSTSEPSPRASSLWSRTLAFVRWRSLSPIRMRKWISKSLITAMGTRAPVLVQVAEEEIPGAVLERLQNRYLLRLEPRFGTEWLELAHDRLVGPITRSNARHIASSNHNRIGAALIALLVFAVGWGWLHIREVNATEARRALIADMKQEIVDEPDLGLLIQACARSRSLEAPSTRGMSCPEDDTNLSDKIVSKEGVEESAPRQPELHAYIRSPFGPIVDLVRQGDTYRAMLDNGEYFMADFERPAVPTKADLKSSPRSPDFARPTDITATDASREYAVASRCMESCVTQLKMLNDRSDSWAIVEHDRGPKSLDTHAVVRGIAASGKTLMYAVCGQGSAVNCPATVQVYRLSDNRLKASRVGDLPGAFDIISMAASETSAAVAYRSIGGSIKVKVYPVPWAKSARWLPDGSRIFDVPFETLTSLLFDKEGKILVASAKGSTGEAYLIDWNLAATIFDVKQLNEKVATSPLLAQLMGVSRNGNVIVTALGTAPGSSANSADDLNQSCLIIEEIEGDTLKQLANDTKCADSAASGDRIGWNTVAMDASGSMIAAANQFNNKGIIIERSETSYKRIADDRAMEEFTTVAISKDGKTIVLGSKDENIAIWTKREDSRFEREYSGTIDSSCVRVSGPQHRVSAISFYGNSDANFLVGTQEGCLAFFEKGVSGWKPQLIDTQMPDVITASISPDFRWAALGTASGRIQIWDLSHSIRPPAIVDARLPWSSTFAWLSLGDNADGKWMIFGNSRFGPVGAWLIQDNPVHQSPTVSRIFPPIWVDKSGIVAVSALNGSLLAATTDGRLLQFSKVASPQAIVDRLIDRACEISRPLVGDKAYPPSTAKPDDDAFISEIMNWSRARCRQPSFSNSASK
jgi:hypothetical protein